MLPPNSRPPNSLSLQIHAHGFISISKKLLIHGYIRKNSSNSRVFLIILQWIESKIVNYEFMDFKFTEISWSQKMWIGRLHCMIFFHTINHWLWCATILVFKELYKKIQITMFWKVRHFDNYVLNLPIN